MGSSQSEFITWGTLEHPFPTIRRNANNRRPPSPEPSPDAYPDSLRVPDLSMQARV